MNCSVKVSYNPKYLNSGENMFLGAACPLTFCGCKDFGESLNEKQFREEIDKLRKTEPINKNTFGSIPLAEFMKKKYVEEKIQSITLIGISTDICVISNNKTHNISHIKII